MSWPTPKVGQVIRYAYLWKSEADAGHDDGVKARPAAIVVAQHELADEWRLVVAPITHSPPSNAEHAIEVPAATRRRVGLDEAPQWIVLGELNAFHWPGPDLRPIPGQGLESVVIGLLPAALSRLVNQRLQDLIHRRLVSITTRTE